jgi:hypothetical protein
MSFVPSLKLNRDVLAVMVFPLRQILSPARLQACDRPGHPSSPAMNYSIMIVAFMVDIAIMMIVSRLLQPVILAHDRLVAVIVTVIVTMHFGNFVMFIMIGMSGMVIMTFMLAMLIVGLLQPVVFAHDRFAVMIMAVVIAMLCRNLFVVVTVMGLRQHADGSADCHYGDAACCQDKPCYCFHFNSTPIGLAGAFLHRPRLNSGSGPPATGSAICGPDKTQRACANDLNVPVSGKP